MRRHLTGSWRTSASSVTENELIRKSINLLNNGLCVMIIIRKKKLKTLSLWLGAIFIVGYLLTNSKKKPILHPREDCPLPSVMNIHSFLTPDALLPSSNLASDSLSLNVLCSLGRWRKFGATWIPPPCFLSPYSSRLPDDWWGPIVFLKQFSSLRHYC